MDIYKLKQEIIHDFCDRFAEFDAISEKNTYRILQAFRKNKVNDNDFRSTTGYGYGDVGRNKLEIIWAEVFGGESALVRNQIASGTHALSTVLFGLLRPGDELVAVTGKPYDTMCTVIGRDTIGSGSLAEWGIKYKETPMGENGPDMSAITSAISINSKVALIQRSRGYSLFRPSLSCNQIKDICWEIKKVNPNCLCFVDNCYGEFVEEKEPAALGADILAGSLIKNPGGGLAPSGGYIVGKKNLVKQASFQLTAPGIGSEIGASLSDNRLFYQGLFMSPHITAQALKSAVFAAALLERCGFKVFPKPKDTRQDIIQALILGDESKMLQFCQTIQNFSPVDSYVRLESKRMPGYRDPVVMAGGTFVQGSSIELSADGPIRPPFAVYLQGGLVFEHSIIAITEAVASLLNS